MIRIGIVCYPTLGGSGVVATELGHELAERGYEVHFIAYEVPFRLQIERSNIFFHEVGINQYELFEYPDYALTLAVKIAQVAKEHSLDILHVHYAIPHAASAYLAKQLLATQCPKVVTTLHGTDITLVGKDPGYSDIVKFSMEQSDAITAVSQSLKQETLNHFHLQKAITVIPNFFKPNKEILGKKPFHCRFAGPGEKLLVHSSNFRFVKRVPDVIQIFAKVRKAIPSKLLLLGHGKGLQEIITLVHDLGLEKEVIFLGKIREIDSYIASGDLFLLPSEQESFGLSALEAMAYGVPVIATHTGGLPEVVEDGVSGYLSPVGDTTAMADKAIELLSSPARYASMSAAAQNIAQSKFCVDVVVPQYEQFYKHCL